MEQVYQLLLPDYSIPAFISGTKPYFGTEAQIAELFSALREDERCAKDQDRLLAVYDRYCAGERDIIHRVEYEDVPFLTPVKVLAEATSRQTDYIWEYENIWEFSFKMRCDEAENTHIWLSCQGKFYRCIRTVFTNLLWENTLGGFSGMWGGFFGFPKQLDVEGDLVFTRLFAIEKYFNNKKAALEDYAQFCKNPDPIFRGVIVDMFGDG